MFKQLKMKIAARRIDRKQTTAAATKRTRSTKKTAQKTNSVWNRVWNIICAPFRWIASGLHNLWQWIRSIDLIGLVNLTLLVAIIVLFSMLIIDVLNCRNMARVQTNTVPPPGLEDQTSDVVVRPVAQTRPVAVALPVKTDAKTNKFVAQPIQVVTVKKCTVTHQQTAKVGKTLHGDIIIDSRGGATVLGNGDTINGNLYLQNMRKYTLPCGVKIKGHLFLRDLNMLQFCGDFTVTGNIYVSPRSSFGPLPRTARLGGQVIL